MKNSKVFQARISPDESEMLEVLAAKEHRSASDTVRTMIRERFEEACAPHAVPLLIEGDGYFAVTDGKEWHLHRATDKAQVGTMIPQKEGHWLGDWMGIPGGVLTAASKRLKVRLINLPAEEPKIHRGEKAPKKSRRNTN